MSFHVYFVSHHLGKSLNTDHVNNSADAFKLLPVLGGTQVHTDIVKFRPLSLNLKTAPFITMLSIYSTYIHTQQKQNKQKNPTH